MSYRCATALLAASVFAICGAKAGTTTIVAQSTFDSDMDGWTSNEPSEIQWSPSGGNPGGRVLFNDNINDETFLIAPSKFLSGAINYTALDGKAYLSFQHEIIQDSGTGVLNYEIDMSGPAGSAVFLGGPPPQKLNKWFTVSAPLNEGNWTVTSGSWKGLLTDVETIQIRIELINAAPDVAAMDNIKLVSLSSGFAPR